MQPKVPKNYLIGCSGYYYPNWKNKFYPAGVAPKNWLAYYSTMFNTVELNGTFYRTPKLQDLQKYAAVTPNDFKFSVKISRYITHVLKMQDCRQQVSDFQGLINEGLGNKMACFLFQMPPSFQYNDKNLEKILQNIPRHSHNIVELRNRSWWNDTVKDAFTKMGITFCNVDFPGLETYFMQTSELFYLRLHGNPELFKSSYSEAQLKAFYQRFPVVGGPFHIYFNNTYYEAGYQNALQMMDIAGIRSRDV
jgi:uncharacterized protein YecE (DUF72 family)